MSALTHTLLLCDVSMNARVIFGAPLSISIIRLRESGREQLVSMCVEWLLVNGMCVRVRVRVRVGLVAYLAARCLAYFFVIFFNFFFFFVFFLCLFCVYFCCFVLYWRKV